MTRGDEKFDLSDFVDAEETEVSASAPLVDFGGTPAELTQSTCETDMSTMPETRNAALEVLRAEVDRLRPQGWLPHDEAERQRQKVRNFPHGPGEPPPPREARDSRSLASRPRGDMKAGLTSSRPKLSIVPAAGELYQCRAMEYGADKYRRGNYHGAPPEGVSEAARVMGYVDAAMRHLRAVADAYNREHAVAQGPASLSFAEALSVPDTVASGGFPASGLPHLAHALASVALAVQCGVDDGLLPEDPGQPWKGGEVTEDRSPEAVVRFSGPR